MFINQYMDKMKYSDNVTLADTGIPGGAVADTLASSVKNLAAGIRNKAKAKEAQRITDAGNYWTLRPFLKSLIPIPQYILDQVGGQGITENAVIQLPEQGVGSSNSDIIKSLKALSGNKPDEKVLGKTPASGAEFDIKKYLPFAIGIIILGILIYFIYKSKK